MLYIYIYGLSTFFMLAIMNNNDDKRTSSTRYSSSATHTDNVIKCIYIINK